MNRRKFLGLSLAGSALTLTGLQVNAATSSASNLSGLLYTKNHPGRWAKKAGGHVPQVKTKAMKGGVELTITTPHPMVGYEHYIVKHVIYDAKYNVVGEKMFDPKKDKAPVSTHALKNVKGKVYVVSVCNKHDSWVVQATV